MQIQVTLSGQLAAQIARSADRLEMTRDELIQKAVQEYIVQHDGPGITEMINAVINEYGQDEEGIAFCREAARQMFRRVTEEEIAAGVEPLVKFAKDR